jgi:hypothetical protein
VVKVDRDAGIIYLVDNDDGMSVTNDAERVVAELMAQTNKFHTYYRIIYRDTDGNWDELCHDGAKFTGYRSWRKLPQGSMPT